jgi:hypothetical protein
MFDRCLKRCQSFFTIAFPYEGADALDMSSNRGPKMSIAGCPLDSLAIPFFCLWMICHVISSVRTGEKPYRSVFLMSSTDKGNDCFSKSFTKAKKLPWVVRNATF